MGNPETGRLVLHMDDDHDRMGKYVDLEEQLSTPTGSIVVTARGDGSLVTLHGEIDATLRTEASMSMVEVVRHGGPVVVDVGARTVFEGVVRRGGPVVIDASEVTFIDSSGLAFVLQLHRLSEEAGQRCALLDPPALVLELLDLIGMGGRIPLEFTPGDAALAPTPA